MNPQQTDRRVLDCSFQQALDRHTLPALLEHIRQQAREAGLKRVCADLRGVSVQLSLMDHHDGATWFVERCAGLQVAFVFDELTANCRYGEDVAVNRGGSLRLFTDPDAAHRWLLDPEAGELPG